MSKERRLPDMAVVYVLDKRGNPLMPTRRCGHVRKLLDSRKAVVVRRNPFTIRLKYDSNVTTQRVILGIDPGRTNIGMTAVIEIAEALISVHGETNNKDVPKRMQKRAACRRASRNGERKRRQRRAVANGTVFAENETRKRLLPGYENPIELHYIKNSEAKFLNRKRPAGWLTPTARHLLQCHINMVKKQMELLPITDIVIEVNRFAFMAMDNPNIQRWQYQQGPLYGKGCVEDAVFAQQDGHCIFCDKAIEHYHHVVHRSKGGSETLDNRAGICAFHHELVHKEREWERKLTTLKAGLNKRYHALSVLNQVIPYLLKELESMFPGHVYVTDGRSTKAFRDEHSVAKDHHLDAYCIACSILETKTVKPPESHYEMVRFRRHDRAATARQEERKYYLNGKLVARNRHKRMEQKDDSLAEFREKHPGLVPDLKVVKGLRKTKDVSRILPGAVFLVNNQEEILLGRHGNVNKKGLPNYYEFVGIKKYVTPRNCSFLRSSGGWQFINQRS